MTELNRRSLLRYAAALSITAASVEPTEGFLSGSPSPFRVERISQHVYAIIAQKASVVNGNSMFIVTRQGLVVVDAQASPLAALAAYDQFSEVVGSRYPVRFLINSHHHLDHCVGNSTMRQLAGPAFEIISTPFARTALEQSARWLSGYLQQRPAPVASLGSVARQDGYYEFLKGFFAFLLSLYPAETKQYLQELSGFQPVLANMTFENRLSLDCGDVNIDVLHLGRGHSAGDAVVHLRKEGIVFTGDLVHGIDPLFFEAYPGEWPSTLGRLEALDFDTLVPGHGPVQHGKGTAKHLRAYIDELNNSVRSGIAAGKSLNAIRADLTPQKFRSLQDEGYLELIRNNRKDLLGLTDEPAVAYGVDEVYLYYSARRGGSAFEIQGR